MSEKTGARPEGGQLEAVIENTVFRNEENGYSIMEARAGRGTGLQPLPGSGKHAERFLRGAPRGF